MVISKGSYAHGESKNVLPKTVQTPYLPLRGSKITRFMGGSTGPRMEICETLALPIPMVSRFNQSNGYVKRKLRAWRVQNCIALVGADTVLTTALAQSTPFQGGYRAQKGNMPKFGPTYPHCTTFAPSNRDMKRKLRALRVQKGITLVSADTVLPSSWPETTLFHGR